MTSIGQDSTPKSWPCRTVYLTSYLVGVVLLAAYSAALISFLAVKRAVMPFETLHDLLGDETYNLNVPSGVEISYFRVSNFQYCKSILKMWPYPWSCGSASTSWEKLHCIRNTQYSFTYLKVHYITMKLGNFGASNFSVILVLLIDPH
jgi:hypothetical protein